MHTAWQGRGAHGRMGIRLQVDCVANADICAQQKIHAFPTLRLFRHETPLPPDYNTVRRQ